MEKEEIFYKLKKIVSDELSVENEDRIQLEANFIEDLMADSMSKVMLVMVVEEVFGIKIPDEEAEKIATVGQAVDYLAKRLA